MKDLYSATQTMHIYAEVLTAVRELGVWRDEFLGVA